MAIAGRVAIVPKGDWSADATYKRLDAVTYNNTLYFAKKNVPAGTAVSNTEYWSKSIVGGASAIATTEDAGVVKPDGKSMSVDESGTLSINLDGTTITLDEAKNVIKLADALKEKIGSALQPESIVNNQITTVEGFALDARQANPNLDGTLAKQVADLNGSLFEDITSKVENKNCNILYIYKFKNILLCSGETKNTFKGSMPIFILPHEYIPVLEQRYTLSHYDYDKGSDGQILTNGTVTAALSSEGYWKFNFFILTAV